MLRDGLARFIVDFQRAQDALFVVHMEPCGGGGVNAGQLCVQRLDALGGQTVFQHLARFAGALALGEAAARHQGVEIQSRAAHDDGQLASRQNIVHAGGCLLDETGHGVGLLWIGNADHVVGDALHFLRCGGGGADGHAPVDLHGIGGDDFAVKLFGQLDAELCFAAGGGAHDADDLV